MPPRKSHLKSRNGCKECKRRKIKCDEAPIICGACRKSRITCSFTESQAPQTASEEGLANQKVIITSNSLLDLELLHHFTIKTSASFSTSELLHQFYRETLVQYSFTYGWMLHTILTMSAFHLALQKESELNCSPETIQRYRTAAFLHYDQSVSSFRQGFSNVNEENCHRYYVFGALLALGSFARPRDIPHGSDESTQSRIIMSAFLEAVDLVRGMHRILSTENMYRCINLGPMAIMLRTQVQESAPSLDEEASMEIQLLIAMFQERSSGEKSSVCQEAATFLRRTFVQCSGEPEISKAFYWPSSVSAEYMSLVKANEPEALLVLAYWCVLLNKISWCWIMKGWPVDLLEGAITPVLDDTWKTWLRWPLAKIRTDKTVD
ncbi:hypothetical protein BGZ60DRAFT_515428 [Tricladium varicosporioides]|nr:hypothetical protein BGZ60DRAFT_515428 [Hymenoscyphus varicosporioides]